MKNRNFFLSSFLLICMWTLISCAKSEDSESNVVNNDTSLPLPIGLRSDIGCEDCVALSHCCCKVILDQDDPIELEICGISRPSEGSCTLSTGAGPCYSIGSRNMVRTLDQDYTSVYFCIAPGSSFALHNMNGSGPGKVKVGCSTTNALGPLLSVNLNYANGSYVRHFISDNTCAIDSCDW